MGADFEVMPSLQPQGGGQGRQMMIAMALMMGVLAFSLYMGPKPAPAPSAPPPAPPAPVASVPAASPPPSAQPAVDLKTLELTGRDLRAMLTNEGAGITWLTCLRNPEASVLYDSGILTAATDVPPLLAVSSSDVSLPAWGTRWTLAARDAASARFETVLSGGVVLSKTIRLPKEGYVLEMTLEARNSGASPVVLAPEVLVPTPSDDEASGGRSRTVKGAAVLLSSPAGTPVLKSEAAGAIISKRDRTQPWKPADLWPVRWGGMTGGYFAAMVQGGPAVSGFQAWPVWADPGAAVDDKKRNAATDHAVGALVLAPWTLAPGESRSVVLHCYAGPKKEEALAAVDPALPQVLDRGMIDTPIMALLRLLHALAGNYGVAIILLTLLVRGAIHPLNRVAQASMMTNSEKMKRLQPRIEELKKRYKNNARKLMEEQSKVMKEEGMSPFSTLGGCLPMLLQMPVLWALYRVLQSAIELRGAPFAGWILDLAKPDTVLSGLPFIGALNPLPIALIGVTVFQMWRAPKPSDPQMAQQQQMMMVIMPIMFGFMFYSLPSGITLYWFTSTSFSILEQWHIRRGLVAKGLIPAKA